MKKNGAYDVDFSLFPSLIKDINMFEQYGLKEDIGVITGLDIQ